MRNPIRYMIVLSMILIMLNSCTQTGSQSENINLDKLNFITGEWVGELGDGTVTENWVKSSDTVFSGQSYFMKGTDTLSRESITLRLQDTSIFYIPLVAGQNDNKPVVFRLTYLDSTKAVFENPEHDFPQKISYELKAGDSLIAVISGMHEGETQSVSFPMKKQKTD